MTTSCNECPECHSDDLEVENTREIRLPKRQRNASASDKPLARSITVRCRACGWTDVIVRKLDGGAEDSA